MAGFIEQLRAVPRVFNKTLFLSVGLIAISQFNFGFDQTAYSTTQAMDAFKQQFGTCNANGKCSISTYFLSLLNSLPYIGFVIGRSPWLQCLWFESDSASQDFWSEAKSVLDTVAAWSCSS